MKFKEDRPFANPEAALAGLLEISRAASSVGDLAADGK
jgi:hypothetical protein